MNSTAAPRPRSAVFYLDASIYSRVLADRMRAAGVTVHHAGEAVPHDCPDTVWLVMCGERGWIVLMRDKQVRRRRLELESLMAARVIAFVCTAGEATAVQVADAILRHLRRFVNISMSERRPLLFTFGLSGKPTRLRTRTKITRRRREAP